MHKEVDAFTLKMYTFPHIQKEDKREFLDSKIIKPPFLCVIMGIITTLQD